MIKRQLIKPRKVLWVMKDFINEIHGITYTDYIFPAQLNENETVDEFMERFCNAEQIEVPARVKLVQRKDGFAVCPDEEIEGEFYLFYNLEELYSTGHRQFSQDFFARCPMGRGFASITITILHELGHLKAQQKFDNYNRASALRELKENFPRETINFEYFKLPDEKAATDWAIEWLSYPENRKTAKAFEKKFFECFK